MTATKEAAHKALADLWAAASLLDSVPDELLRNNVKRYLLRVETFMLAARSRLPTKEAVECDRQRKRGKTQSAE